MGLSTNFERKNVRVSGTFLRILKKYMYIYFNLRLHVATTTKTFLEFAKMT